MLFNGKVLIYGCSGALGKSLTTVFAKHNWKIIGCDYTTNFDAHTSVSIPHNTHLEEQTKLVDEFFKNEITSKESALDAIICASGGFAFGNNSDPEFITKAKQMISSSIEPSLTCAHLATKYLKSSGLLVLPGAAAAFEPNGFLLGYAASKAYVHYLVKSLASNGTGMPKNSKVLGIAPVTLDTENNRLSMPDSDTSSWTPLTDVSNQILYWSTHPNETISGTIFKFNTKNGITTTEKF